MAVEERADASAIDTQASTRFVRSPRWARQLLRWRALRAGLIVALGLAAVALVYSRPAETISSIMTFPLYT